MAFTVQTEAPPLREDATGALRVGNSRVLLELVIRTFQDGAFQMGEFQVAARALFRCIEGRT